jgi:hypothetical protein
MSSFTQKDSIFEWGEKFVYDHPNYTIAKLKQYFYKQYKT